ncbi:MAG: GNAT family N-acetyltransferase [Desertifilum sp.]|nr:GNAT family N-acetyltransferase [Desertifilum sp.]
MLTTLHFSVREATLPEDPLIAQHFYQLWLAHQLTPDSLNPDWFNITLEFIVDARQRLSYQAFVAEVEGKVVGSASCQLFAGLYPLVFNEQYRKFGYIWGVYVEPDYRNQGIAKHLTRRTTDYLKSIGCTQAVLNASPLGKPVYTHLGFTQANEMRLDLV